MKTQSANTARARAAHHAALETLRAPGCKLSGMAIWRKLRRLEQEVHDATTAQCNGATYGGQPFRPDHGPDGEESDTSPWQYYLATVKANVTASFGQLPAGFFVNGDARGYALKLAPGHVPDGMHADWGSNGILAAEID